MLTVTRDLLNKPKSELTYVVSPIYLSIYPGHSYTIYQPDAIHHPIPSHTRVSLITTSTS